MMTEEYMPPIDDDLDVSKPEDEYEDFNRRILFNPLVRKYMLGEGPHPNMLLPWEEVREGLDGHTYFVDLATDEITWRPDAELEGPLPRPYANAPEKFGVPPGLWYTKPEVWQVYFKRREAYVHFWEIYLRIRENLLY